MPLSKVALAAQSLAPASAEPLLAHDGSFLWPLTAVASAAAFVCGLELLGHAVELIMQVAAHTRRNAKRRRLKRQEAVRRRQLQSAR